MADHDDLIIDDAVVVEPARSISSSGFSEHGIPDGSPGGNEEGPLPFILLLLRLASVAEAKAADGEHEDEGEEERVFGPLEVIPLDGKGPPGATPAGSVYEHWYVDRPPLVRSSRIAKTIIRLNL